MLFRIKSEAEMSKPYGKCIRFLEDLQFVAFRQVVPTDDPKWFRRVPLAAMPFDTSSPPLIEEVGLVDGNITNKGCLIASQFLIDNIVTSADLEHTYKGWYFDIEWNGNLYSVPQIIVDIPMKWSNDYKMTAREFYKETTPADSRAKMFTDILIEEYESEMNRSIGGPWDPNLTNIVIERFEKQRDLAAI